MFNFPSNQKKIRKNIFHKRKKNKNNEYLEIENTTTGATLEKEKKVTEYLQRDKTIKYEGYN